MYVAVGRKNRSRFLSAWRKSRDNFKDDNPVNEEEKAILLKRDVNTYI